MHKSFAQTPSGGGDDGKSLLYPSVLVFVVEVVLA